MHRVTHWKVQDIYWLVEQRNMFPSQQCNWPPKNVVWSVHIPVNLQKVSGCITGRHSPTEKVIPVQPRISLLHGST